MCINPFKTSHDPKKKSLIFKINIKNLVLFFLKEKNNIIDLKLK